MKDEQGRLGHHQHLLSLESLIMSMLLSAFFFVVISSEAQSRAGPAAAQGLERSS